MNKNGVGSHFSRTLGDRSLEAAVALARGWTRLYTCRLDDATRDTGWAAMAAFGAATIAAIAMMSAGGPASLPDVAPPVQAVLRIPPPPPPPPPPPQ